MRPHPYHSTRHFQYPRSGRSGWKLTVQTMAPREIHPLTQEQAWAFLDAASYEQYGERLEALSALALASGMRSVAQWHMKGSLERSFWRGS